MAAHSTRMLSLSCFHDRPLCSSFIPVARNAHRDPPSLCSHGELSIEPARLRMGCDTPRLLPPVGYGGVRSTQQWSGGSRPLPRRCRSMAMSVSWTRPERSRIYSRSSSGKKRSSLNSASTITIQIQWSIDQAGCGTGAGALMYHARWFAQAIKAP